jgi:hypothetical protein
MAKITNGMQNAMVAAPSKVADTNGGTPKSAGNSQRGRLIERRRDRCPG